MWKIYQQRTIFNKIIYRTIGFFNPQEYQKGQKSNTKQTRNAIENPCKE